MKNKEDMTLAVVGTGRWGTNIIRTLEKLNIKYICCNTRGEHNGKECFDDWIKMLNTRPDGVIIAANPALNLSIMQHAELLGIPVMVEKPVAFYLADVHKMAKLKIPILVDYIHLFNDQYKKLKKQIKSPITRIASIGYNFGPFRHFSGLFDYGPHELALAMDLLPFDFQVANYKIKSNPKSGGRLYTLEFKAGTADVTILCGNGGNEKVRKFAVWCLNGDQFTFEDEKKHPLPLESAINHFIDVINGQKPNPSFDLTTKIHTSLYRLGNHWEKEHK